MSRARAWGTVVVAPLLGEGGHSWALVPDRVTDNIRHEKLTSDANFTSLTNLRCGNRKFGMPPRRPLRDMYPAAGTAVSIG